MRNRNCWIPRICWCSDTTEFTAWLNLWTSGEFWLFRMPTLWWMCIPCNGAKIGDEKRFNETISTWKFQGSGMQFLYALVIRMNDQNQIIHSNRSEQRSRKCSGKSRVGRRTKPQGPPFDGRHSLNIWEHGKTIDTSSPDCHSIHNPNSWQSVIFGILALEWLSIGTEQWICQLKTLTVNKQI